MVGAWLVVGSDVGGMELRWDVDRPRGTRWWVGGARCGRGLGGRDLTHLGAEATCPQTLLDLGASPDYKDSRGLTALYHSALGGGDALCCELLLHDHAQLGTTDENGWQEIHQVGRAGIGNGDWVQ